MTKFKDLTKNADIAGDNATKTSQSLYLADIRVKLEFQLCGKLILVTKNSNQLMQYLIYRQQQCFIHLLPPCGLKRSRPFGLRGLSLSVEESVEDVSIARKDQKY
jgi:hypothetical protein